MKNGTFYSLLAVCAVLAPAARAQQQEGVLHQTNAADKRFIRDAYQNSRVDRHLGELVQQKSQNSRIQAVAKKLVSDCADFQDELRRIWPETTNDAPQLTNRDAAALDHLRVLLPDAFEIAALRQIVRFNRDIVRKFDREGLDGENSGLKQLALATLPILQSDLDLGQALYTEVKQGTQKLSAGEKPSFTDSQRPDSEQTE